MKKIKLFIALIVALSMNTIILKAQHNHGGSTGSNNHQNHVATTNNSKIVKGGNHSFKVDGNCEECRKRIETAALAVKGVKTASWDMKTNFLTVNLKSQTELEDVYQAVAKEGHDNEKYQTADKIYSALPKCCQYRKY